MIETLPQGAIPFFSDEANFHLLGYVNRLNICYWNDKTLRELHQKPLHSEHVTVWCALQKIDNLDYSSRKQKSQFDN